MLTYKKRRLQSCANIVLNLCFAIILSNFAALPNDAIMAMSRYANLRFGAQKSSQKLLGCSSRASVPPGLSVLLGSKYALSALNNLSCSLPIEPSRYGAKSLPMP